MEPKKPLNESIFRARQSTEGVSQPQSMLFLLGGKRRASYKNNTHHAPLNESHINLMQSWMNLRGLDNELAETRYSDLNERNGS